MNPLSRIALRHPRRTLAAAALLALASAPGLRRLDLRTDGQALVPRRAPAVIYDAQVRRAFGVRDPIVVVVRSDSAEGIFNPVTLRRVRDLTGALSHLDGIDPTDVTSLATETGFRFRPGSLLRATLLEPLPETPAALAELRRDLRRIGLFEGTLVAADGASAAVLVGAPSGADRRALVRRVREVAARFSSGRDRVDVLGAPVAETLLGSHILADLGVPASWLGDAGAGMDERGWRPGLVPLSLLVMGLVLLIGFRRPAAAVLPLVKVGACLDVVFGLMGWLGVPVYLTTAVLPVLLIAVGTASEVHLFRRHGALWRQRPDAPRSELAHDALDEVERPVLQAAATTAVGFLSFVLSPLGPVRVFGLFAALGVLLCLLASLSVTPAFLVLAPPGWINRPRAGTGAEENAFAVIARFASRHHRGVLAAVLLIAMVSLDGVRRVAVQDSWIDGFAPGSAFARQMRRFESQFRGAHLLQVVIEADSPRLAGEVAGSVVGDRRLALPAPPGVDPERLQGSWIELRGPLGRPEAPVRRWSSWVETANVEAGRLVLSWPLKGGSPKFWLLPGDRDRVGCEIRLEPLTVPATLRRVRDLEAFLARRPNVGGAFGPAGFLATANFLMQPDQPGSRRLPDQPEEARILWRNSERVRGEERLRRLVDAGYSRGLVTVFLRHSNYADTRRLMREVRTYERRSLAPHGLRLGFAGDVAVSQALIGSVVATQVSSLALSLLGIFAVTAWLSRSVSRGLLCVLPAAFAVLLNFAAMGWFRVPLGVATSMFAGMALGVGVDYAIHLLARHASLREDGLAPREALAAALATTGPAILIDSWSSLLGFAVLLASQVPANHRLGGLLALSLFDCMLATLLIIPALLARQPARQAAQEVSLRSVSSLSPGG